ncbi:DUF2625 domain-containing protein [Zobellia galactanivorans]|uniref:DUF2625 domain-containing protein n=1 Tax=Zobellia galactanivorans (strain DSM 12802 / CCUG 47099 / CIP 106680 / NCIMB 13871 / Dsij) TaxID=63186 RepID=UPI001C071A19|nr:DUF2625 domain-containing protein [Zobellia galactanivorans]MBU3024682.1 DUF2625 domain-containing protein [Zobellia galactanivorans]MDO6810612.1 DUF2625 domain-containing protein [Zobellia galactanivorans]
MKPLAELLNKDEPGWELVSEWIKDATNKVVILPKDEENAKLALYHSQVTTRSPLGAIIYETGGIVIDGGWIRILGSGDGKTSRTISDWNIGKSITEFGEQAPFFLVADDVIGGFFAINGGKFGQDLGQMYYFAPDCLEWEAMDMGYSDFIWWTLRGDLEQFYKGLRWKNWREEIESLETDKGMGFFPFLWTEYDSINDLSRKPIPMHEIWDLQHSFKKEL